MRPAPFKVSHCISYLSLSLLLYSFGKRTRKTLEIPLITIRGESPGWEDGCIEILEEMLLVWKSEERERGEGGEGGIPCRFGCRR